MCLQVSYKKKKIFFTSLKSLTKGVGSGVGSGFFCQRYGSAPKCHGSPTLRIIQQEPNLEELKYGGVEGLPSLGLLRLLVDTAQAQHFPLLHAHSASRWVRAPAQPFLQLLPTPANSKWQWTMKENSGVMPSYIFVDTLCWRLLVFFHQTDRYMWISTTAAMYWNQHVHVLI
jgi:hypothetical protein